ncbi:MAG: pyruvate kinase [Candidatus Woesearchaeota archaeon]
MKTIVTIPPYATFIDEVVAHSSVEGLRLNVVMPIKQDETIEDVLKRLYDKANGKDLWIDLKGRQLRVENFGVPPFTEIRISHNIKVDTPVEAYFNDGKESATILEVCGNQIIMQEGPKRVVGPGESINIPSSSLTIEGFLTDTDKRYIEAAKNIGLNKFMLSYVEGNQDIVDFRNFVGCDVDLAAKIESSKGLDYVQNNYNNDVRLMTARGDLFVEVNKPHEIIKATYDIIKADKNAIVASRIFPSLAYNLEPECSEINDVDNLMRMGYRTFMLGDDVCQQRNSLISALNLFKAMTENYKL